MTTGKSPVGKTSRQLNLVGSLLRSREGLTWADVAVVDGYDDDSDLRSRRRRFERDLRELEDVGLVIRKTDEGGGRIRYELDRKSCLLPPLNLAPAQRLTLYRVGASYLDSSRSPAPGLLKHLASALVKLQAAEGLPDKLPVAFVRRSLQRRAGESDRFAAIVDAIIERRRISFRYRGHGQARTSRTIAPWGVVARRGGWYLVGYDGSRKGMRTFRVSRIQGSIRVTDPKARAPEFEIPADFDAGREFSPDVFGDGPGAFRNVRVRFEPEVAFVIDNEFSGAHRLTRREDGGVTLHLPSAYPNELLRYLAEFPGLWTVEGPRELRDFVVERMDASLRANGGRA